MWSILLNLAVHVSAQCSKATQNSAISSGNWNSPEIWSLNRVPNALDSVCISFGVAVEVPPLKNYSVKSTNVYGTLQFSPNDLNFVSESINVFDGGLIQMKTSVADIKHIFALSEQLVTFQTQNGLVMDLLGWNSNEGAVVGLWNNLKTENQRWKIEHVSENTVRIISQFSQKAMSIAKGSIEVKMLNKTANAYEIAQLFQLERLNDGAYKIKSLSNGLYLGLEGNNANPGSKMISAPYQSSSQNFVINVEPEFAPLLNEEEAEYLVFSERSGNVLDILGWNSTSGSRVGLWENLLAQNQKWILQSVSGNICRIISLFTQNALQVSDNNQLVQYPLDVFSVKQMFFLESKGPSSYSIKSVSNNLYLTIADLNMGTFPSFTALSGDVSQQFLLKNVKNWIMALSEKTAIIRNEGNGKVLDVLGWSVDENAPIGNWHNLQNINQQWKIEILYENTIRLISLWNQKALSVLWNGIEYIPVQKTASYSANEQFFVLERISDNSYRLKSVKFGLYLTVLYNEVRCAYREYSGDLDQIFRIEISKQSIADLNGKTISIRTRSSNRVMDIYGWSTSDNAVIAQWDSFKGLNQKWKVNVLYGESVKLISAFNEKALSMLSSAKGAKVVQRESKITDKLQVFVLQNAMNGYYRIIPEKSPFYLTSESWKTDLGANLVSWDYIGNPNQQFAIEVEKISTDDLDNKLFFIRGESSARSFEADKIKDIEGAPILQMDSFKSLSQAWKIQKLSDKSVRIISASSGKALTISSSNMGAYLTQRSVSNDISQRFALIPLGNGFFKIKAENGGFFITADRWQNSNRVGFVSWNYIAVPQQHFKFESANFGYEALLGEVICIRNQLSSRVFDVLGWEKKENALIGQWDSLNSLNQKWKIEPLSAGSVRFVSMWSGKVLTMSDKYLVQRSQIADSIDQRFLIEAASNGFFKIRSLKTNEYLTIEGMKSEGAALLISSAYGALPSQHFKFELPNAFDKASATESDPESDAQSEEPSISSNSLSIILSSTIGSLVCISALVFYIRRRKQQRQVTLSPIDDKLMSWTLSKTISKAEVIRLQ
jgi:hypothetical protein